MYSSLIHKHSGYLYNKERGIGEWEWEWEWEWECGTGNGNL